MYKADWGPLTAYTISTCLNDMVDNQCTYLSSFFSHNQGGSSSPSSGGARVYAQTRRTISLRPSTRPRPGPPPSVGGTQHRAPAGGGGRRDRGARGTGRRGAPRRPIPTHPRLVDVLSFSSPGVPARPRAPRAARRAWRPPLSPHPPTHPPNTPLAPYADVQALLTRRRRCSYKPARPKQRPEKGYRAGSRADRLIACKISCVCRLCLLRMDRLRRVCGGRAAAEAKGFRGACRGARIAFRHARRTFHCR